MLTDVTPCKDCIYWKKAEDSTDTAECMQGNPNGDGGSYYCSDGEPLPEPPVKLCFDCATAKKKAGTNIVRAWSGTCKGACKMCGEITTVSSYYVDGLEEPKWE